MVDITMIEQIQDVCQIDGRAKYNIYFTFVGVLMLPCFLTNKARVFESAI